MDKELVIDSKDSEIAIALLEDKRLVELSKEKSSTKQAVGDIFLGRVKKIMPGLNAAFINIGGERDAFLHYLDLGPQFNSQQKFLKKSIQNQTNKPLVFSDLKLEPDINKNGKISEVIAVGQEILVQMVKEPISTKGPRLTSEITVAGRNLVLVPFSDKVSVSQRIKGSDEKNRLKHLVMSIKPHNYGVIVRTVAKNRKVAVLHQELDELVKKWEGMFANLREVKAPALLLGELNRTSAMLRDLLNNSFNNIHVNDDTLYREITDYIEAVAPEHTKIVKKYNGNLPIFKHFGVSKQMRSLFGKTITIKNGAYIIIEHTEALHVIDVNSGNRIKKTNDQETNAIEVNLAAAEEIARQLRLRDMGGIIVIDFIDMHTGANKQLLYEKMKEFMATDRTKHNILPLSKFGLMQITRQRVRPVLTDNKVGVCPVCKGSGQANASVLIVDDIYENFKNIVTKTKNKYIELHVHPYLAAYLTTGTLQSIRFKWFLQHRRWCKIKGVEALSFLDYKFFNKEGERI